MKFWISITTATLLGILIAQLVIFLPFTIDDAYITFSHAKTFVNGYGLIFNRGAHVEATSSFLWAVLLIPFEALLPQGALIGSKVLGVLSICGTVVAGALLIKEIVGTSSSRLPLSFLYALAVITNSSFITWATYGMENGLMAFLLMATTLLFVRETKLNRGIVSALLLIFIEMCRPEGFMFVAIFAILRVIEFSTCDNYHARTRCVRWLTLLCCGLLSYETFGLLYYGHLLPNSATAKVPMLSSETLIRGIDYLREGPAVLFLILYGAASFLIPFCILRHRPDGRLYVSAAFSLWLCITAQIAFSAAAGGDWMVNSRFLSHVFPLLIALIAITLWRLVSRASFGTSSPIARTVLGLCAVCGAWCYVGTNVGYAMNSWKWQNILERAEEQGVRGMAEKLNELDPTGSEVVACSDIGRIGYYYRGRVMDWFGLADEEIAQNHLPLSERAAAITLARKPTFLVLYSNKPLLDATTLEFGEALHSRVFFNDPEFSKNYEQIYALPFWPDRYQVLFRLKK
jgi:hypothetical protein